MLSKSNLKLIGLIVLLMSYLTVFTVVLVSLQKPESHQQKRNYPRMDNLEPIRLRDPSIGILPAIVRLYDEKNNFFCSGTIISSNYLLTAGHCVLTEEGLSTKKIYVKSMDKLTTIEARAATAYQRLDVALVHGDFSQFKYAHVVTEPSRILSERGPFLTCGMPGGGDMFCSAFYPEMLFNFGVLGTGAFFPGASGGPVMVMPSGDIIGVISYVLDNKAVIGLTLELWAYLGVEVAD